MKSTTNFFLCASMLVWLTGCGAKDATKEVVESDRSAGGGDSSESSGESKAADAGSAAPETGGIPKPVLPTGLKPVPVNNGSVEITPDTSRIVFVGSHAPPKKPDPRTGGFEKFVGKAKVVDGKITAIDVEIDTNSIFTFNEGLTGHLKNADFFEVNEFPNAKFTSKSFGNGELTGELTMHGVTKEISFPATVMVSDDGLTFAAAFRINRFDFGMDGVKGGVLPGVNMQIAIGKATNKEEIIRGGGGGPRAGRSRGPGGRGGGGGWNPMEMFAQQDSNKDGKLSGDEIPEQMRGFLDRVDTDSDGAISKEEIEAMATRMRDPRGGGGGRPGGGGDSGRPQRPAQ